MNHAPRMRERHRVAHFLKNRQQISQGIFRDCFRFALGDFSEHILERCPLDEFHRVENLPVLVHAQFVNGHDVRVFQLAEHFGFLNKPQLAFA